MQATITREFTLDAAHSLPHHLGVCHNLHGHTYHIFVEVRGEVRKADGDPTEGMVMDFGELKGAFNATIMQYMDHQNLNKTLPVLPTAEVMAGFILVELTNIGLQILSVTVFETPTSSARVDREDLTEAELKGDWSQYLRTGAP